MQYEEERSQMSYHPEMLYDWNLDGLTEWQTYNLLNKMGIAISIYRSIGKSDREAAEMIISCFTGVLKGWWDHMLTDTDRQNIRTATKQIIQQSSSEASSSSQVIGYTNIADSTNTLLYAICKHFLGNPEKFQQRSSDILIKLRCPKLHDFRGYKDIFLTALERKISNRIT